MLFVVRKSVVRFLTVFMLVVLSPFAAAASSACLQGYSVEEQVDLFMQAAFRPDEPEKTLRVYPFDSDSDSYTYMEHVDKNGYIENYMEVNSMSMASISILHSIMSRAGFPAGDNNHYRFLVAEIKHKNRILSDIERFSTPSLLRRLDDFSKNNKSCFIWSESFKGRKYTTVVGAMDVVDDTVVNALSVSACMVKGYLFQVGFENVLSLSDEFLMLHGFYKEKMVVAVNDANAAWMLNILSGRKSGIKDGMDKEQVEKLLLNKLGEECK